MSSKCFSTLLTDTDSAMSAASSSHLLEPAQLQRGEEVKEAQLVGGASDDNEAMDKLRYTVFVKSLKYQCGVDHSKAWFILPANAIVIRFLSSQICSELFASVDLCSTPAKRSQRKQRCDIKIRIAFAGSMDRAVYVTK